MTKISNRVDELLKLGLNLSEAIAFAATEYANRKDRTLRELSDGSRLQTSNRVL